ncbi:MAG TPA: ABC transporter substrate-binding protein [Acidimicrobiia bacterium]|nr:ABC transporter substrate-binding protein [Acidimicrobiia bacterium]
MNRLFRQRSPLLVLALALALMVAACDGGGGATTTGGDGGTTTSAPQEMTPLTVALTNQRAIQYAEFYAADALGFFEEEGLDVEIVIVSGSSATVQQIVAGNVDIGNPSGPAIAQGFAQGNCLKQLFTISYKNVFGLATPQATGIDSLEGLSGGVIGVSEPGGGEIPLIRAIMASVGLEEGTDYQLLPIGEGGAVTFQALENGDAQAYSSSIFDVASLEAAGMPLTQLMPEEFQYFQATSPVVTCEYYDANTDLLARFGRAIAKGAAWVEANQDQAKQLTRDVEPELWEDEALAEAFWVASADLNTPPAVMEGEPWGTHYRDGWELYLEFASQGTEEEGAIDADAVDLDVLLEDELIPLINDFDLDAVTSRAYEG